MRRWTLDEEGFTDDRVRYVMDSECLTDGEVPWLDDEPEVRFRATYDVHAADTLTMSLTVVNTGDVPMSYEAALHSYLHVGDVSDSGLVGLRGATYLDATKTGFPPRLQEPEAVTFGERPVDRVYYSDSSVQLRDAVLGRVVHIVKSGSPQTVVWNPGKEGDHMRCARPGEWRGFVAVEAAACRDRGVTLAPGESHTLSQTLSVETLDV